MTVAKNFIRKLRPKGQLACAWRRWKEMIKTVLNEIVWEGLEWIHLVLEKKNLVAGSSGRGLSIRKVITRLSWAG